MLRCCMMVALSCRPVLVLCAWQRVAVQEPKLQRVLIECGPWTGCTLKDCPQRQVGAAVGVTGMAAPFGGGVALVLFCTHIAKRRETFSSRCAHQKLRLGILQRLLFKA